MYCEKKYIKLLSAEGLSAYSDQFSKRVKIFRGSGSGLTDEDSISKSHVNILINHSGMSKWNAYQM